MNFALFGYLISLLAIVYSLFCTVLTYRTYKELTFRQRILAEIAIGKNILTIVVSIIYIVTYYLLLIIKDI